MNLDFFSGSDGLSPFWDRYIESIQNIKNSFPSVWKLAGEAIALAEMLVPFVKTNIRLSEDDYRNNLLAVWNRIRVYQINSILQIFGRNLDEGLSILRMAAELCFVFKAIDLDEHNYHSWIQGSQTESFKKACRMDFGNATEKQIYDLYKFCCRFGTHGHITNFVFQELDNEPYQPSVKGASEMAKHWFISFISLHTFAFERLLSGNLWEGIDEWRLIMINTEAKLMKATIDDPFFI
jgi:hypothetical protein